MSETVGGGGVREECMGGKRIGSRHPNTTHVKTHCMVTASAFTSLKTAACIVNRLEQRCADQHEQRRAGHPFSLTKGQCSKR